MTYKFTGMKECPDCHGECVTETMTYLSVDGDQRWNIERCETCGGLGEVDDIQEESEVEDE